MWFICLVYGEGLLLIMRMLVLILKHTGYVMDDQVSKFESSIDFFEQRFAEAYHKAFPYKDER